MAISSEILTRLESIRNLPTLPAILDKFRAEIANPRTDASRVARIIEDDPSMMARILKVVNSALYGASNPITTVQHAVARMGFNAVNNIALSTAVFSSTQHAGPALFDRKEFWRHCISTGIAAGVVYKASPIRTRRRFGNDLLHLAGLVHDIGKIIFEAYFAEAFAATLQACRDRQIPLYQLELEIIGTDHAQVGAWLGQKWKLAPEVVHCIRWHHEPANAPAESVELVQLCHAANYLCNLEKIGDSGDSVAPFFFQSVWKSLELNVSDISTIIDRVKEETAKSDILLALS